MGGKEMSTKFWLWDINRRDHLGDQGI